MEAGRYLYGFKNCFTLSPPRTLPRFLSFFRVLYELFRFQRFKQLSTKGKTEISLGFFKIFNRTFSKISAFFTGLYELFIIL